MKPEPDEIDRIICNSSYLQSVCSDGGSCTRTVAGDIRRTLLAAGYAIVLDEAQLLEKGREIKIHD